MSKVIKLRANKVTIETPTEGAEPWLRLEIQRVEKDTELGIYNIADRWDSFNIRMSAISNDVYMLLFQPNGASVTVGDIGLQLTYIIASIIADKYNGTLDAQTLDVIVES